MEVRSDSTSEASSISACGVLSGNRRCLTSSTLALSGEDTVSMESTNMRYPSCVGTRPAEVCGE